VQRPPRSNSKNITPREPLQPKPIIRPFRGRLIKNHRNRTPVFRDINRSAENDSLNISLKVRLSNTEINRSENIRTRR